MRRSKANSSLPALVILPSLSYSKWVVPVSWSVLWVRLPLVSSTATSRKMVQSSSEPSATTRQGGRMPSKAKSVSLSKKLQPVYRIDRMAGSSGLTGNTGFERRLSFELVVHIEHIANAYDVALADFNRRRMHHRPGRF